MTLIVALGVGWYAVHLSNNSQYTTLDSSIDAVINSGVGHPLSALSDALYVVQQNNADLTLDVVDQSGAVTQVNSGKVPLTATPTLANVRNSRRSVISANNLPGFVFRSVDIGGGSYLLVAASTSSIVAANHALELRVALVALVAAFVMSILARFVVRPDVRSIDQLIHYASAVARGDENSHLPPSSGSSAVRELRSSLSHMVASLRSAIKVEKETTDAMQRFVGDASHELRTPLTVIQGFSELLATPGASEEEKLDSAQRIKREVIRIDTLVSDLLFLAEVRDVPEQRSQSFDLSEFVTAKIRDFETDNPQRQVQKNIQPSVMTFGSREYFERLLSNAFTNIQRYTSDTTAVAVGLKETDASITLAIEDAGAGIPEEAYGATPKRFQRYDVSRSRSLGGSGLGMSIMHDVAQALGGEMTTAKSELGGLALHFTFVRNAPSN
jgi:signal transduction histidine kinase